MTAAGLEGAIAVRLRVEDGRVVFVEIANERPRDPGRMFVGRRAAEVPAMLPLLFSLCGTAQLVAGLAAVEEAAGLPLPEPHRIARSLLVTAETVLEHGQRILRDWPALTGAPPDLAAVKDLRAALVPLRGLLHPGQDWARPGGGALAPDVAAVRARIDQARAVLHRGVYAGPPAAAVVDPDAFTAWARAGSTAAARLAAHLCGDLAAWGANDVPPLPTPDPRQLSARLDADATGAFLARPEWQGCARFTHPLCRLQGHPLVAELLERHGNGALALAAARLVELQRGLDAAEALAGRLAPHPGGTDGVENADGAGLGMVEAARGLLAHRVEIAAGRVARYQILAPTEWNFHPDGALAAALRGAPQGEDLEARTRLLAALVDPCVAFSVSVEQGHGFYG